MYTTSIRMVIVFPSSASLTRVPSGVPTPSPATGKAALWEVRRTANGSGLRYFTEARFGAVKVAITSATASEPIPGIRSGSACHPPLQSFRDGVRRVGRDGMRVTLRAMPAREISRRADGTVLNHRLVCQTCAPDGWRSIIVSQIEQRQQERACEEHPVQQSGQSVVRRCRLWLVCRATCECKRRLDMTSLSWPGGHTL